MKAVNKNILIGLFVTSAIMILISMILFLDPKVGDGKKTLKVRFANIAGIADGTRVTYAGKPVGEVVSIHEIPHARLEKFDETGRIYCYLLTLKLDSSVSIYDVDEIAIRSTGLMGEKSIAILPRAEQNGRNAKLIGDEVMIANSIDPLENTFNQITKTAHRIEGTVTELNQWFKQNQQPLTDTLSALHQTIQNIDQVARDIVAGTGTLGRFIGQDDLYLRLISVMSKAETLMNDVNHYGLLFQYDKHWQRSRTKRANLLKSLTTPKEFRSYFETEIDAMNTSLGRLTELLEKSEEVGEKEKIIQNPAFRKQFAHLMRQIDGLAGSIKLYNEGLIAEAPEE